MVSANVGFTFILGGIAVGQPWDGMVWCFALMAFLIDLGEEIAGDAMDIEGDKKRGSRSIGITRGRMFALRISAALFGLVILVSWIPILYGWAGISYLILIGVTDVLVNTETRSVRQVAHHVLHEFCAACPDASAR